MTIIETQDYQTRYCGIWLQRQRLASGETRWFICDGYEGALHCGSHRPSEAEVDQYRDEVVEIHGNGW